MFGKGEYIVYGNSGVCQVVDYLVNSEVSDRTYYVLAPVRSKASTIYSPIDNKKVIMRKVISREEAERVIAEFMDYEDMEIINCRTQEQQYKQVLQNCDCIDSIRLAKALYHRKLDREKIGRKITSMDEKYLFLLKDCLINEFAIALGITTDAVEQLVQERASLV